MSTQYEQAAPLFFLFPQSIKHEDVVKALVYDEVEAYLLRDPYSTLPLLQSYPKSFLFFNADSTLDDDEWIELIDRIVSAPQLAEISITVMAFKTSGKLIETYCTGDAPRCGFIRLRQNASPRDQILKLVDEEKGRRDDRRKSLRVKFNHGNGAHLKMNLKGVAYNGRVTDMSGAGMVCSFKDAALFQKDTLLEEMTISRGGERISMSGYVAGYYKGTERQHVILFTNNDNRYNKKLLYDFMYTGLQDEINKTIDTLKTPS